jgi:WD40 repeat protein
LADWIPSDKHGSILLGHGNSISILDAGSLDSENIGWNSSELFVDHEGIITCIRTSKNSKESAVGVSNGTCHLIDTHTITHKCEFHLSNMRHESFMQCMDWNPASPFTLAMGTSDGDVILIDCRIKNHSNPFHVPKTHNVNICSVAWHINGHYLAAGRADSLVNVWDVRYMNGHVLDQCARNVISKVQLSGKSVVKSVQWCPWMPNSIAAGGGNDDCTVAVWDVMEPTQLVRIGAQGPVQGLHWSEISRELVACTGNQFLSTVPTAPGFKIWSIEHNYKHVASVEMPAAFKQDDTTLAYMQPIHLAWSPCGEVSLIVDADGQLSFWRLFDKPSVLQKISNNVYHVDQFKGVPLAHYNDSSQISPYPIWPTTVSVPVRKSILPIKTRHRHPAMPYNKLQLSPLYR